MMQGWKIALKKQAFGQQKPKKSFKNLKVQILVF